MPSQHSTEEKANQEEQGIVVPLELEGLRLLKQAVQADGTIRIEVMGSNERARCPHCQTVCAKRHDVRKLRKRDVPLREHRVEVVQNIRRFWCLHWKPRVHRAGSGLWTRQAHDATTARADRQASLSPCNHACGQRVRRGSPLRARLPAGRGQHPVGQARIERGGRQAVAHPALALN